MPPRQDPTNAQLAQAMAQMAQVMTQQANAAATQAAAQAERDAEEHVRRAQRVERDLAQDQIRMQADFNRHGPPKFQGEVEPEKADLWIQEMEKIFEALHTPEGEKVGLATFMLKGDAEYWWWSARQLMTANLVAVTWDSFKRAFMNKYFPETAREDIENQFLGLRQGIMTVGSMLLGWRLSRHLCFFQVQVDEPYLCNRFMIGLRNDIEESVRPLGIRVYQQLVEKAREVETMKNRRGSRQESGGPIRTGQKQAGRTDMGKAPQRKPYQRPSDKVPISGKGEAIVPKEDIVCFKCNQKGHYANECGKEII
ncbi:uncharacterized protein LOC130737597 [Lotus japonicus]|uniref:uncharacterized protein LOC130737597 n=1 Tax=Lotus japonicus TaxID=34305 RepID=UPI002588F32B|nr:uncharacterized protein LOC130737597 [Lotus japonicus]